MTSIVHEMGVVFVGGNSDNAFETIYFSYGRKCDIQYVFKSMEMEWGRENITCSSNYKI